MLPLHLFGNHLQKQKLKCKNTIMIFFKKLQESSKAGHRDPNSNSRVPKRPPIHRQGKSNRNHIIGPDNPVKRRTCPPFTFTHQTLHNVTDFVPGTVLSSRDKDRTLPTCRWAVLGLCDFFFFFNLKHCLQVRRSHTNIQISGSSL